MKTITIKNFAGLTYMTVKNVPLKDTEFGDVINIEQGGLERIVSCALILNRVPIRGAEFKVMKSALILSNQFIADKIGINKNTVLKWGKNPEDRLPIAYEMLFRILIAEMLNLEISTSIDKLRGLDRPRKISVEAA